LTFKIRFLCFLIIWHYINLQNTIISFDLLNFLPKIYLILYPSLRKLLIHTAILVAPYFLAAIEEAFLLQMTFYYYWALLGPQIFWAIRRSCGLHAGSVCLIFLTHLFVCISKTMFFFTSRYLALQI
jgi:hypothetical protein